MYSYAYVLDTVFDNKVIIDAFARFWTGRSLPKLKSHTMGTNLFIKSRSNSALTMRT